MENKKIRLEELEPYCIVREISKDFDNNKTINDNILYDEDQLKILKEYNKNKKIKMKVWYLDKKMKWKK